MKFTNTKWWLENVEFPFFSFMCRLGWHRIVWERWDGVEHCHCGGVVVDVDKYYVEKE